MAPFILRLSLAATRSTGTVIKRAGSPTLIIKCAFVFGGLWEYIGPGRCSWFPRNVAPVAQAFTGRGAARSGLCVTLSRVMRSTHLASDAGGIVCVGVDQLIGNLHSIPRAQSFVGAENKSTEVKQCAQRRAFRCLSAKRRLLLRARSTLDHQGIWPTSVDFFSLSHCCGLSQELSSVITRSRQGVTVWSGVGVVVGETRNRYHHQDGCKKPYWRNDKTTCQNRCKDHCIECRLSFCCGGLFDFASLTVHHCISFPYIKPTKQRP